MSTLLTEVIGRGEMTQLAFELLLDHKLGTSFSRYRLGGNPELLKIA